MEGSARPAKTVGLNRCSLRIGRGGQEVQLKFLMAAITWADGPKIAGPQGGNACYRRTKAATCSCFGPQQDVCFLKQTLSCRLDNNSIYAVGQRVQGALVA